MRALGRVSRQGCLIAALVMFTGTVVHPLLTLIISMELSVFLFFIIVYSFAINRYMPFILWPITVSAGARPGPRCCSQRPASPPASVPGVGSAPLDGAGVEAAEFRWKRLRKEPILGEGGSYPPAGQTPRSWLLGRVCSTWEEGRCGHYLLFPSPVPAHI